MIRFKVIRGSRLLLAAAVCLLIVALALLGAKFFAARQAPPVSGSASLVDAAAGDEAETTLVFASSAGVSGQARDDGGRGIVVEVVEAPEAETPAPSVLIYHTHTHEAYEQVDEDPYKALEAWRTSDADHSVVRVGAELAEDLRRYGFHVVHDTTDHEGTELSTAYTRSLETLEGYAEPFDLYIDLHRDAWMEGEPLSVTLDNGEEAASLMMLIGNGNGFDEKPWFQQNRAFAAALEGRINAQAPGLCKPVLVKDGRYNQHIGVFSVLIEVGHNRNTLRQALNAVPPLAAAIHDLMVGDPDPELLQMKAEWMAGRS